MRNQDPRGPRTLEDAVLQKTQEPSGPRTTTFSAQRLWKQDYFLSKNMVLEPRRLHVRNLKQDTTKAYFLHYDICKKNIIYYLYIMRKYIILAVIVLEGFRVVKHSYAALFSIKTHFYEICFFTSSTKQI